MKGPAPRPLDVRFWEKVDQTPGCWLWRGTIKAGRYGVISERRLRYHYAHRLSYELNVGPIPNGMAVCHTCDNPPCVNPAHLFLGTQQDNLNDMRAKGRERYRPHRGEENGRAVLDWPRVREIRARHAAGETGADLARAFRVGETTVHNILQRRRWRDEVRPGD